MIYAIADIHGHINQLERALRLVEADGGADAPIVFLGDYVDRGPDSAGVLARLIKGIDEGRPWTCLKGNHDRMLFDFLEEGAIFSPFIKSGRSWLDERLGGLTTLASYMPPDAALLEEAAAMLAPARAPDLTPAQSALLAQLRSEAARHVPQSHRDFLAGLRAWHGTKDLIFAHAGIRPGLPMGFQQEDDLVWIREPFLSDPRDHGALIVHGHTILKRPQHYGNRVNLDGGAGAGRLLIPAVFEGRACHILTERGRWPLTPPG